MFNHLRFYLVTLVMGYLSIPGVLALNVQSDRPNVLLIMVDDLNDCIGVLNGHPQNLTPNMDRLAKSGVLFKKAYTNAPMCGPSRSSMLTGVLPHHSGNFYQAPWFENEILSNTRTMMEQFKEAGYWVSGTGKILHHLKKENWSHFENPADYTPTPFDGEQRLPHPDVPKPFSDIGWVDGSLGPFINLEGRTTIDGKPLQWITGGPNVGYRSMRYVNDDDRDPTPDEINAEWAAQQIKHFAKHPGEHPFFLAVGFLRPHTPLVAPQKYFDQFPLDQIRLTVIKSGDSNDTHLKIAYKDGDVHALRFGNEMFAAISKAYGSTEAGLKKWTQAYLACIAAVDENVGRVMDALDQSKLKENTIVVLASDHGFHMGEKDYLYKNSLWEESTRIPLMMRVPGITQPGSEVKHPVSLIDVYPTLLDLCNISKQTTKNEKGHSLDGHSMQGLLVNPRTKQWKSNTVLTAVYAGDVTNGNPANQHYALRSNRYRYIRYNTGEEELYDHKKDPFEWFNLAGKSGRSQRVLAQMRQQLKTKVVPYNLVMLNGSK